MYISAEEPADPMRWPLIRRAQAAAADTIRIRGISDPVKVRYAWYSYGPAGLYGGTGLAAAPFEKRL